MRDDTASYKQFLHRRPLQDVHVEDVSIPHTWCTVNAGNKYLQIQYFSNALKGIDIDPGNHSSRAPNAAIVAKINAAYNMGDIFVIDYDVR